MKVLDFGLAKVRDADADGASLSNSPTMMTAAGTGMILGTAAYMSPEQARGSDADRTADVWAFGCVLYEMLTGRALFQGETVAEILAGVLKTEPDWRPLPAETPEGIRRLLRRCLQKEPNLRVRDIRDARIEIDESKSAQQVNSDGVPRASRTWERVVWISALAGVVLVAFALVSRHAPDASVKASQYVILPPPKANFTPDNSQAISPNGRQLVFAATAADGASMLWVRSLDSLTARSLAGTEEGSGPFWSPDSASIGFFARGKLKRIDIAGGLPQTLADSSYGLGGAWGRDGVILFSPNLASPLLQIPAGGGTAKPATIKDARRRDPIHMGPSFLPDGRRFLFWAGPADPGVYVASLDANEVKLVLRTDSAATYSPPGYLLFMRDATLMAQPFDAGRMSTTGDPMPVAEQMGRYISQVGFSVSDDGVLVFRPAGAAQTELVWVDRTGRPTEGGTQPRWRRDGKELFYLAPNRKLMAVTVNAGSTFEAGTPRPLFDTRLDRAALRQMYAVSSDGNRFLLNVASESAAPPLTAVVNWRALLKK